MTNTVKKSLLQEKINEVLSQNELDQTPVPTGKLSGGGPVYYFPSKDLYAPMKNGEPDPGFVFSSEVWNLIGFQLPSVDVAKSNIIKKLEKAAEVKINKYRISLQIDFSPQWVEDSQDIEGTYTIDQAIGLLDRCGHHGAGRALTDAIDTLKVTIDQKGSKGSKTGSKGHIGGTTDRFNRDSITQPVESYKIKPVTHGSSAHTCLLALQEGSAKDQDRVNEIAKSRGFQTYDVKTQNWKVRQVIAQTGYGLKDGYLVFPEGMTEIRTK